ncbi:hypothetical protein [Microbacterium excoecariae]|uniref:hypothetical protein n=1 Tax=Microbacterium excoecariae TaxID=2715210 RepID=UPI0014086F50|nr:hypothetical protein [Microbacterium excoecariae]NHI17221.1 hypothetical protein [Microbacterium excoecariae]
MNVTVPTHPPCPDPHVHAASAETARRAPRPRALDRLAMRLGLALIVYGTRPPRPRVAPGPDVSGYRPGGAVYAPHAADSALARHALLHGAPTHPFGR